MIIFLNNAGYQLKRDKQHFLQKQGKNNNFPSLLLWKVFRLKHKEGDQDQKNCCVEKVVLNLDWE